MVDFSVVDSRYVTNERRLDAEYYRPYFLKVEKVLWNLKCDKLENLAEAIKKGIFSILAEEYRPKGIPFLRVSNIGNPFIEKKDLVFISPEKNEKHKATSLKPEDIVISKGGTLGYVGIITPDVGICNICQDVIGIRNIKQTKINPYFLVIFLLTKYGQYQLQRGRSQQVQAHLNLDIVRRVLVPILSKSFQLHIKRLVKQAYEKRKLAEQKYREAEGVLYKTLGISKEEIEKLEVEKTYVTNFKEVQQAFRFDAEYYHPKYLGIIELLGKASFEIKPLKEVVKISNEIVDPTKEPYKTKRVKYVPIAKISESGEIFEWEEFYGWQAPSRARMVIRKNDLIIPSLTGTFDKIALVPEELNGQLTTTGCFVIRAKENYPEFLFLLLRSPLFKRQLEQQTTGAIMSAVPKTVFGDLLIHKVPKDKQREIADLVRKYFKLRKEARQLIQLAIKETEEMIENVSKKPNGK